MASDGKEQQDAAQSDLQLARELIAGTAGAFEHFVNVYGRKIFRYSYTMCGHREDAEEIAQETLMKVFENLGQLREPEHMKAWVFQIGRASCRERVSSPV